MVIIQTQILLGSTGDFVLPAPEISQLFGEIIGLYIFKLLARIILKKNLI